jgi:hypothetical protein
VVTKPRVTAGEKRVLRNAPSGVILLGWALTTLFVAGFTRIVRTE